MRRAIATITGTIAVMVMLLSFKTDPRPTRTRPAALGTATRSLGATPESSARSGAAGPTVPSSQPSRGAAAPQSQAGTSTSRPPVSAAAAPAAAPAPAPAPAKKAVVTGQIVDTNYGPVQVQIKLSGSKISDIQALQLPNDRSRSAQISSFAAPQLRLEALSAQSARIDTVSGATYTSDGYAQSLQSALDRAHVS